MNDVIGDFIAFNNDIDNNDDDGNDNDNDIDIPAIDNVSPMLQITIKRR